MSIQKLITQYGSLTFSEATLNPEHLLVKAHDFMLGYNLNPELRNRIISVFHFRRPYGVGSELWPYGFLGQLYIPEDKLEEAHDIWGAVCDYFDSISPPGYYFGTLEGDGACFGWFPIMKESVTHEKAT